MKRLRKALAEVPSIVLVGGEAGIGKTRLVREFAEHAGATVLSGGCVELGSDGLPFAPFSAALRGLVREVGVERVRELLPGASGLARLLPEFGEAGEAGGESRARMFELVLTLLERLGPVVLVIEDAHWADRSSRDLLEFLIRNLGGRVMIVVTYRSDALDRAHPLRGLLAELARVQFVERIELRRFTRAETRRLLHQTLGREPDEALVEQVFQRSEGNPLFAEALAGIDGRLLPDSLRDLLLIGFQRLPEETRELLRVAAAGGTRFAHGLLTAVAGLDDMALNRALRPAVAANVLVADGDGYSFRHSLIREAVYDDLLPGELNGLHVRYAEALTAQPSLVAPGRAAGERAYHWYAAHEQAKALESAWEAAEDAARQFAHAEALRMLERVLELWDRVPDGRRAPVRRLEVLSRAADFAAMAGEEERGIQFATEALKEAETPEERAKLLGVRGHLALGQNRLEGLDDMRGAIAALPEGKVKARALAQLAVRLNKLPHGMPETTASVEEALRIGWKVDDMTAVASALITRALRHPVPDAERLAMLDEVEPLLSRSDDYDDVLRLELARSHVLEGMGRHEDAIRVARLGIAKAEAYGLIRTTGTVLGINVAEPMIALGRWDEALAVIERAIERRPLRRHRAGLRFMAGAVHIARGELDVADVMLASAWATTTDGPLRRAEDYLPIVHMEITLRLAEGRPDLALAAAARLIEPADMSDETRYTWPALVAAVSACATPGDLAPFEARAAAMEARGELQRAHRLTFEAHAARIRREPQDWAPVRQAWTDLSRPYDLAKALHHSAEHAAASGDRAAALAFLAEAAPLAESLRAKPLSAQITALRSRLRTTSPAHGLTPRELEVLRALATGRSNREIAEALFISAKTVSVHVSNILAKLHAATRTEAVATAHQEGFLSA
ncbi:regulatory LuxR family protein [Actinocorallia herbida]|uniref:Regulatory LuxR family protein n=1 Tax=Actinocorallia herbida TaxID=58109 RepID=A0A3N1CUN2_9ACTN|nr:regulatory LuxR family protein [Actinocorallia herbida]